MSWTPISAFFKREFVVAHSCRSAAAVAPRFHLLAMTPA
jgi:hypothetical protein